MISDHEHVTIKGFGKFLEDCVGKLTVRQT